MVSPTNINKIQYYAHSHQPRSTFAQKFFNVYLMLQSSFALSSPSITTESPTSHSHYMSLYTSIFKISSLCVYVVQCCLLYRCSQIKNVQELRPFHTTYSRKSLWARIPANITTRLFLLSGAITYYYERY